MIFLRSCLEHSSIRFRTTKHNDFICSPFMLTFFVHVHARDVEFLCMLKLLLLVCLVLTLALIDSFALMCVPFLTFSLLFLFFFLCLKLLTR